MECALNVGEVRSQICSYLDPEGSLDRTTLLNLALTDRQWGNIALDTLWNTVKFANQTMKLIQTLGPLRSSGTASGRSQQPKTFDYPTKAQWTRFESYAGRIRRMNFCDIDVATLTTEAIVVIANYYNGGNPFTRLRVLSFEALSVLELRHSTLLSIFGSPAVQSIDVFWSLPRSGWSELAETLKSRFPCVKSVCLRSAYDMGYNEAAVTELDCSRFPLLETFRIQLSELSQLFLSHASSLSNLQDLHVRDVREGDNEVRPQLEWPDKGYDRLRRLTLVDVEPESVLSLFGASSDRLDLSHVALHVLWPAGESNIPAFSSAVRGTSWPSLTSVDLKMSFKDEFEPQAGSFEDIGVFMSLRGMESFKYRHDGGVNISREQIVLLIENWKDLRCLHIGYATGEEGDNPWRDSQACGPQIGILDDLALMCPKIESLGFTFSDQDPPMSQTTSRLEFLRHIDVSFSMSVSIKAVSLYFCLRLRRLPSIIWEGTNLVEEDLEESLKIPEPSDWSSWDRVAASLPALFTLRDNLEQKILDLETIVGGTANMRL